VAIVMALVMVAAAAAGYSIQAGLGPVPVLPSASAVAPVTSPLAGASVAVASPAGTPAPAASPDLQADVAAVEAQVPPLRQLQPLWPVPTRIIDADQLRRTLEQEIDAPANVAAMSAEQDLLVRLGLAAPGLDLRALSLATLTSQVLGFYDPTAHAMTIVNRIGDFGLTARFTIAHEYTHALQDQHFDLARLGVNDSFPTDRVLAVHALVEGDASLLGAQWLGQHITLGDLLEVGRLLLSSLQPVVPAGTPLLISRTLLLPYLEGMSFVAALYRDGGWAAVDRAYARPPTSTAEILHPDRYLTGWTPTPVGVPSLGKVLGAGWTRIYLDTLGEVTFQVCLDQALDADAARRLAADWTGDQVVSWGGPSAGWVIAWRSTWATVDSALALASVADRLLAVAQPADRSPVHVERVTGTTVTLLLASDRATLDRVSLGLGG
jgi:hypothetical protein